MGAAAHLSAVPTPLPPKRGGGGRGPEGYIETVHRIYADKRAGHEARELLLAVAYAVGIAPAEEGRGPLNIAARLLGRDRIGRPRFNALMAADAPRYEAPRSAQNWGPSQAPPCEAPRLRPYRPRGYQPRETTAQDLLPGIEPPIPLRTPPPPVVHVDPGYTPPRDWRTEDNVCGAQSHHRVIERDPATGWVTARWFCRRHREGAERGRSAADPQPGRSAAELFRRRLGADLPALRGAAVGAADVRAGRRRLAHPRTDQPGARTRAAAPGPERHDRYA